MKRLALTMVAALLLGGGAIPIGDQLAVQSQIDDALAAQPGGVQTSADTVSWNDGDEILTVAGRLSPQSVGSCATGAFCAFNAINLGGSKLSFTACGIHSTAALPGTVKSIANARTTGTAYGENSAGLVLSIIAAHSYQASSPSGVAQLDCVG